MVDFFLLLQLTGAGDELQGIKRGIMEMADAIVINKAEGKNLDKAKLAQRQLINALHLFPAHDSGFDPQVLLCSALEKTGIEEVWQMIDEYVKFTTANGFFGAKRRKQNKYWMYESINEQLRNNFYNNPEISSRLEKYESMVLNGETSSFTAAQNLLDLYYKKGGSL